MVRFSKGRASAIALVPNHSKTKPFEIQTFLSGFHIVFNKMLAIWQDFKFQISDFRSHSKFRPFANQPVFDHSKSRLVWNSDPTVAAFTKLWQCATHKRVVIGSNIALLNKKHQHSTLFGYFHRNRSKHRTSIQ